ncbi:MAG: DUF6951 family protein [Desulfomonilaceae bacterium]
MVKVQAGACGFLTVIRAVREDKRSVSVQIESACESVDALGAQIQEIGPLSIKDIMARGDRLNKVFALTSQNLHHSACPVAVAILKACEVELGLNVPSPVSIEFEP